jgi:hypothetical protein
MLEQLAIAQGYTGPCGGDEVSPYFFGIGELLHLLPRGCEAVS